MNQSMDETGSRAAPQSGEWVIREARGISD